MRRVHFYIDGFNLYHALMDDSALRRYRWLNFRKLGESIISSNEQLAAVYYFTAFYPGNAAKTSRHRTFIHAQSLSGVKTILGEFRRKDKYCKVCQQTFPGYEEKETDVNIAVQVLVDAALNLMDKCVILSNDSDLLPVIRALRTTYPQIALKLVFPPNQASKALKAEVPDYMRLKERHLASNQFPDPFVVGNALISKPREW